MTPDRWKQIDELAQAALEREGDERAAFLDEACAGDDELRREVESQIAYQLRASKFLEEPAFKHAAELIADPQLETESMEGRTISHYSILRKLGAGGMGEVYLAQDTTLSRKVAIKFLSQNSVAGEQAKKRLVREAKAAAALDHPHICAVYEVGEEGGYSFIVMQYVEGETLASRIQRQPLEVREALDIAVQIADALAEAHAHGIIHRDVKPQNVMLTPSGQVKVLDFGLARVVREGSLIDSISETKSLLSVPGAVIGTVPYMSPEQVRGEALDGRSDIFSFGAVLYEMLSGRNPFQAESVAGTMSSILTKEPAPLARYVSDVPDELQRMVRKALSKDKDGRYQGIKDLLIDLRELKQELEIEAKLKRSTWQEFRDGAATNEGDSTGVRAEADTAPQQTVHTGEAFTPRTSSTRIVIGEIKRHKLAALVILGTLFIAGTSITYFATRGEAVDPGAKPSFSSVAVLPFEDAGSNAGESEYLADGISEALITKLTQLAKLRVIPWVTAQRYRHSQKPLAELARDMKVEALITGTLRKAGDRIAVTVSLIDGVSGMQYWGSEFEEPLADIFSVQRRIAVGAATELKGKLTGQQEQVLGQALAGNAEAYELYLRGKAELRKNGREPYDLAFELFRKALKLDPKLAEAYVGLGQVQWSRYHYGWSGALSDLEAAEASYKQALNLNPALAMAYEGLVDVYWMRGDSEEILRQGAKVARFGLEDPDTLLTRAHAYYIAHTALEEKAVPLLRRVLEMDPLNEEAQYRLIPTLAMIGRYSEAIQAAEAALRKFGERARAHLWVGVAYHMLGDFDHAKRHYEMSISLVPDDYLAYKYLGVLYNQRGQPDKAKQMWNQWVKVLDLKLEAYPRNPELRAARVIALGYIGKRDALLQEEARLLREDPNNGNVLEQLGRGHAALGETERAVELFRQALRSGCTSLYWQNWLRAEGLEQIEALPSYQTFIKEFKQTVDEFKSKY